MTTDKMDWIPTNGDKDGRQDAYDSCLLTYVPAKQDVQSVTSANLEEG